MDIIANIINGTLVFATPFIFAALGGMLSEKSGVTTLGIEGYMVSGAFFTAVCSYYAESMGLGNASPWIGIIGAFVFSMIFSLIHAIATLKYKADHVISGVVINMLASSSTFFLVKLMFDGSAETPRLIKVFNKVHIPLLSDIPFVGKSIFVAYPTTYLALAFVIGMYYILYKTPSGLRLRAVGENPSATDTAGIKVNKLRYTAVLLGGAIASLGGATIVLTANSNFAFNTISGQGYISLAAVIFGRWHPVGVTLGALFFGLAQAVKVQLQIFEFAAVIPNEIFYMLPYLLTLIVLLFSVGKTRAPKALGRHYNVSER